MKKKYTKKDIIKRASYKLHMTHNDCKIITDCILEIFEEMFTENKDTINRFWNYIKRNYCWCRSFTK